MRAHFPLFQSPIDLAHSYWRKLLQPGDIAIDATCGNGHDTLFLAQCGALTYGFDVQSSAIASTRALLEANAPYTATLELRSHETFPATFVRPSVRLIVYNLGYLPGGDKTKTTETLTSLRSLEEAMKLIVPGGAISITCYPGHPEGKREWEALREAAAHLPKEEWSSCEHVWLNRKNAPTWLLLQKIVSYNETKYKLRLK